MHDAAISSFKTSKRTATANDTLRGVLKTRTNKNIDHKPVNIVYETAKNAAVRKLTVSSGL